MPKVASLQINTMCHRPVLLHCRKPCSLLRGSWLFFHCDMKDSAISKPEVWLMTWNIANINKGCKKFKKKMIPGNHPLPPVCDGQNHTHTHTHILSLQFSGRPIRCSETWQQKNGCYQTTFTTGIKEDHKRLGAYFKDIRKCSCRLI